MRALKGLLSGWKLQVSGSQGAESGHRISSASQIGRRNESDPHARADRIPHSTKRIASGPNRLKNQDMGGGPQEGPRKLLQAIGEGPTASSSYTRAMPWLVGLECLS